MGLLRSELISLPALLAFEAAARHANFTKAAAELHVTRVAVSRQIKALEEDLGVQLFHRLHRSVRLNPAGERLFDAVSSGLGEIALTKSRIRAERQSSHVTVTMTAAFATFWLIPRMGRFRQKYPGVDLRLAVSDRYLDLAQDSIDAAIRYGGGPWEGYDTCILLQESLLPVCSPSYEVRGERLECPADLMNERLLHLSGIYRAEAKWPNWFQSFGLSPPDEQNGVTIDAYPNLVQAALEGQGIALCGTPLVDHLLANGSLIRPIEVIPYARDAFYLLKPQEPPPTKATEDFCCWILSEARDWQKWLCQTKLA